MRPVWLSEAALLARAAMAIAAPERGGFIRDVLARTEQADLYRLRTGGRHPLHGDGTLASAFEVWRLPAEPSLDDGRYRDALSGVLAALADLRS